jgi:phosphate-selective porin OprO and OprP
MDYFCNKSLTLLLMVLVSAPACSFAFDENKALDINGYLMLDHDYYGPFYNIDKAIYRHNTEIRRSKLGVSFSPTNYFQSKLQLKYARLISEDGEFSLGDSYVRLITPYGWGLQFGRMKEPFGLEQQTSSSNLLTIERSSVSSSFAPGRSFGLQFDHKKKAHTFAFGYFIERKIDHKFSIANFNIFDPAAEQDIPAATFRITYAPLLRSDQSIHLGASISKRWLGGNKTQIKINGEVHTADKVIRSARFYGDSSKLYQIDAAWHNNNLLLQSELIANSITQENGTNWDYLAAYVQASYRLSGRYRYRHGRYKPRNKTDNSSTEFVIRQSMIDLRDHNIGSEAAFTLLGINYYPTAKVKLMANLIIPTMSGDSINNDQSGQAYSLRIQYKF